MRYWVTALTLVPLVACTPAPSPPAQEGASSPLFREISIQPFGTVSLGADFAQRHTNAKALSPGRYALMAPRGGFADTDSILVHVDKEERVTGLVFVYQAGKDFAAAVAEYEEALGPATARTAADSAGGRVERIRWEDARTRFELTRLATPGQPVRVSSALAERQ